MFDKAAAHAIAYSRALDTEGGPGLALRLQHACTTGSCSAGCARPLGGRTDTAVSGGAPLGARLGHFFRGIGVTVLEGYGLTETTAAATLNTTGRTSGSAPSAGRSRAAACGSPTTARCC